MIKRLFKAANIFKPNKFNYALVDYLADELREVQNIKCKKRNSYIKIKLDNPHDKYESLIVDCFNGKIYLRDNNNKDKKVLNLNRFFGNRESDAMYCAKGGAKQIKNYLQNLNTQKNLAMEENYKKHINMNKKAKDLRTLQCGILKSKQAITIARRDICDRDAQDGAIVYIDGNIVSASTHARAIHNYLIETGNEGLFDTNNRPVNWDMNLDPNYQPNKNDKMDVEEIENNINQLGFAHKNSDNMTIYLETESLQNVDANTVANSIKSAYPDYEILTDESEEKLAKLKKVNLKKISILGRDFAIAIINGEVFDGDTHGEAITKYLKNIGIDDIEVYDRDELELIMGHGFKNQFAAAHAKGNSIYIEPITLENITLNEAVNLIHDKYPRYNIYNADSNEKLAILSRLKKVAWHDVSNRDNAMVYIDGEVYEADTHAKCVNKYLKDHNVANGLNDTQYRPNINIEVDDAWDDKQAEDLQNIYDNIKEMAFCHVDKSTNSIYIEPEGYNIVDMNSIANTIKLKYPNFNIYIDNAINDNYEKVAGYHDVNNRTSAILYIEGQIIEGHDHYDMINQYLKKYYNIDRDDPQLERKANDLFDSLSYAMGSKVDEDKTIYIDEMTLNNVDESTVINAVEAAYPDYNIQLEELEDGELDDYVQQYTGYTMKEINDKYFQ